MRHIAGFFKKKVPVQLISPFIFLAVFLHISGIIRLSPWLAHWLLGAKSASSGSLSHAQLTEK